MLGRLGIRRRTRWAVASLVTVLAVAMSGCQFVLPGRLLFPGYVVNRGGHYYAGSRCEGNVVFAQANWSDEFTEDSPDWPDYPPPFWKVETVPPGVSEVLLFEEGQPGVHTVIDGWPDSTSRYILVTMIISGSNEPISVGVGDFRIRGHFDGEKKATVVVV